MKEEALKLAEIFEEVGRAKYPYHLDAAEMLRRLVEEVDKWENPLYRSLPVMAEKINSKPIAWLHEPSGMIFDSIVEAVKKDELAPLYTAPRELSDEEIDDIWAGISTGDDCIDMHEFARAIIKKASEK